MDYEGIPGTGEPNSNVIFVPEGIPHRYDENGILKVQAVGYDSKGKIPANDPAPENQDEGFHRNTAIAGPDEPPSFVQVVWPVKADKSDFVPGYTKPGGQWVTAIDANTGDPIYGDPPAGGMSVKAKAAQLVVAAQELFGLVK